MVPELRSGLGRWWGGTRRVRLLPSQHRNWQADAAQAVKDLIDATQCLARPGTHQAGGGPCPIEESVRIPAAPVRAWCHFGALRCPALPSGALSPPLASTQSLPALPAIDQSTREAKRPAASASTSSRQHHHQETTRPAPHPPRDTLSRPAPWSLRNAEPKSTSNSIRLVPEVPPRPCPPPTHSTSERAE